MLKRRALTDGHAHCVSCDSVTATLEQNATTVVQRMVISICDRISFEQKDLGL